MTYAHRTYPDRQRLRPRERQGSAACSEKAQIAEVICGAAGQGKTCTAKATLPEPQSAAAYTAGGATRWLAWHIGRTKGAMFIPFAGRKYDVDASGVPACPTHPLYGGASGRTGRLTTSHLRVRVITGWPVAGVGLGRRPVWPRSRRSTRTPGVTAGTAILGWTGERNKRWATTVNPASHGGRAAACATQAQSTEAC